MASIGKKNSKPELCVRGYLTTQGFRYRIHVKKLPGTPDIVLHKYKTVVLVHGCFWHQHKKCQKAMLPSVNADYWVPKLARNVSRDIACKAELKKMGWNVVVVWECDLSIARLNRSFKKLIDERRGETR